MANAVASREIIRLGVGRRIGPVAGAHHADVAARDDHFVVCEIGAVTLGIALGKPAGIASELSCNIGCVWSMPVSRMPILMPAPALLRPPTMVQAAVEFSSFVASFSSIFLAPQGNHRNHARNGLQFGHAACRGGDEDGVQYVRREPR